MIVATCAVCGVHIKGVLLSIDPILSNKDPGKVWFSEMDIERFGATNLAHECGYRGCPAFVCAKCESTLKVEERASFTFIIVWSKQKGRVCPSCNGWFGYGPSTRLLVAGRFPSVVSTQKGEKSCDPGLKSDLIYNPNVEMSFNYHSRTIPHRDEWQVPTDVCCLCMSTPVYEVLTKHQHISTHVELGSGQVTKSISYRWPLCKGCYALMTDVRLSITHPFSLTSGARFANPDYGDLFVKANQ